MMKDFSRETLARLRARLRLSCPANTELQARGLRLERDIILPARLAVIGILYHSFQFLPWIRSVAYSLDVGVEAVISLFWVYVGVVLAGGLLWVWARRVPPAVSRAAIVLLSLADALFLAGLTLITGGYDSILFWVFVGLVIRNTLIAPLSPSQWVLNLFTAACYLLAGVSDYALVRNVDEPTRMLLGLSPVDSPAEGLLVRTTLLLLVAACGFGVQLLLDRQRRAEAEAREFRVRDQQLRSTGRLAAEIAHQLKNPLTVISNTTFNLQRATGVDPAVLARLTGIIREEVERADRILTQVMDYARLTEGRLERLEVAPVLDAAVAEVFPPGAIFDLNLQRSCQPDLPTLMMQRDHLREMVVNLLTNARDATPAGGVIQVCARSRDPGQEEIVVSDNGPGIPRHLHQRIFESYYTTKSKGTGLGLAIVKSHAELYGGSVQVESDLGKGATFSLTFPTTVSRPARA